MREVLQTAIKHSRLADRPGFENDSRRLNLIFLPQRRMTALNRRYTSHERCTDVLAFDLTCGGIPAGHGGAETSLAAEIYVCPDVAVRAARTYSTTLAYELFLYLVHGMLHLAGHDDHDPAARQRMRRAEKQVIGTIFTAERPEVFISWKSAGSEPR